MNLNFMNLMLTNCKFPEEAVEFFNSLAEKVVSDGLEEEFDRLVLDYTEHINSDTTDCALDEFSKKAGGDKHSYWMLLLLIGAEKAKPLYDKRGVPDEVFFDTFSDLRCKAYECMEEYGVWGTFVAFWYGLFFNCKIIKFGRLEYQDDEFEMNNPYVLGDITINNGHPMKSIHIPSSGEPFDEEARLASYKMAYDFYSKELGTDMLVCDCGSWLLYPGYRDVFPAGSNTRDFMDDFDIIRSYDNPKTDECHFHDDWRVFGRHHKEKLEDLPEDTSMRRAFKKHLMADGKIGSGTGMLIFDGEKLLTRGKRTL